MAEEELVDTLPVDYAQLSTVRVPLAQAADVFATKDASGRAPIVVMPSNPHRIRNSVVVAGLCVLLAGVIAGILLNNWQWPSLGGVVGLALIALGVYQSFLVRIPEGTRALLSRAARYTRTLEAGSHVVSPWYAVSHLVTRREIPYDVPAVQAFTQDHVRATVDALVTFSVSDPYRFVYNITADDFDQILLAACLDTIRAEVRQLPAEKIADLTRRSTATLQDALNAAVEPYGVTIGRINITDARPQDAFLSSLEARQLAVFKLAEQNQKQALAQRMQADAETLARQQAIAKVEWERESLQTQVEQAQARKQIAQLEAETEELRLSTLEERLRKYPLAAAYELQHSQLEIGRALAGNTRAVLQIGQADDILRAYVMREYLQHDLALDGRPASGHNGEGGAQT